MLLHLPISQTIAFLCGISGLGAGGTSVTPSAAGEGEEGEGEEDGERRSSKNGQETPR